MNDDIYEEFLNKDVRVVKQEADRIYPIKGRLIHIDDNVIKLEGDTTRIIKRDIIKEIQLIENDR